MKNQLKGFITGVLVTLLLVGSVGTAMATVGTKAANLEYSNIKVTLDGMPVNLVDVNGNPVEPFIISGTTYLPVRAIAGAFGLEVDWDGATQTVLLKHPSTMDPIPEPTQNPVPTQAIPDLNRTIYITSTGKRYHYDSSCNGGTYYETTLAEAMGRGLTPCDKCIG